MSIVEQPEYTVEVSNGSIEVRDYAPLSAAQVEVNGECQAAIRKGFRLIAGYIFGANRPNAKIKMTAPFPQQRQQTIAMMAPVTQQDDGGTWKVLFTMPKTWTLNTLSAPDDTRIRLAPVPAKRMIAIRFTWFATENLIAAKSAELRKYALEQKLVTAGEPLLPSTTRRGRCRSFAEPRSYSSSPRSSDPGLALGGNG